MSCKHEFFKDKLDRVGVCDYCGLTQAEIQLAAANAELAELKSSLQFNFNSVVDCLKSKYDAEQELSAHYKAKAEQAEAQCAAWEQSAKEFANGMDYYRGIVIAVGEMIGEQSYICDDGTRSDSVLCAKIVELVAAVLAQNKRMREALEEIAESKLQTIDWAMKRWIDCRVQGIAKAALEEK